MKIPLFKTLAVFSITGALACSAHATTLVQYLNSTSASFTSTANVVDPLLTSAGAFTLPTSLAVNTDTGFSTAGSPSTRNAYLRTDHVAADETAALALSGRYYSFTLTPGSTPVKFETMTFGLGTSANTAVVASETANAFLRSSLDNFTSTIGTSAGISNVTVPNPASLWPTTIVSQSISFGASFSHVTQPVTFRLYLTDTLNNNQVALRLTNLQITGAAAIPESSTSALAASGMIGLFTVAFRRRRTSRSSE